MAEYTELAASIVELVGGKENIRDLTHCVTRLRFYLNDESIPNDDEVKALDGVMTVVRSMGQYMVVIGAHVDDVYQEVLAQLGELGDGQVSKTDGASENGGLLNSIIGVVMAAMGPMLNLLCACGVIKGLAVVAATFGLPTDSGIYQLLNAAGDGLFYSMPLVLGFNVANKFEIDPFFGLLFGAALTYPTIQGVDLDFFGHTVNATYTSSFLPALFGMAVAIPLYKFLHAHIHPTFRDMLTPAITLLVAFPLTFVLIGPLANLIGYGINLGLTTLFETSPILGGIILGGAWQIMVMFGVHGVPMMFAFYDLLAGNPSAIFAMIGGACWAVCGTLVAIILKTRDESLKNTSVSALASAVLGVTEPAMYGILVPRPLQLALTCVGSAVGGLVAGVFGLKVYTYAGLGFIGLLGFMNPAGPTSFLGIALLVLLPFAVSLALNFMLYRDQEAAV